jgi:hypothetical protein
MNRFYFAVGASLGGLWIAAAAQTSQFTSTDGQLIMTFKGSQYRPISSSMSRFILTGGIHVTAKKKNIEISADHGVALVATESKSSYIQSLQAEDNVTISKHASGGRVSTIRSSSANYKGGPGQGTADFSGSVTLTDNTSNRRMIQATGSSGHAVFSSGLDSKNSTLKQATLNGSVTVHVDQAPTAPGGHPGKLTVNCERLTYTPSSSGALLVLGGHVHMLGSEGVVATMSNLSKVTVHLNSKYESTAVDTES